MTNEIEIVIASATETATSNDNHSLPLQNIAAEKQKELLVSDHLLPEHRGNKHEAKFRDAMKFEMHAGPGLQALPPPNDVCSACSSAPSSAPVVLECHAETKRHIRPPVHFVQIVHRRTPAPARSFHYSVDEAECPAAYATMLALRDILEDNRTQWKHRNLHLVVGDLFLYNVLSRYLKCWATQDWYLRRGIRARYIEILEPLWHILRVFSFTCSYQPTSEQE